MQVATKTVSPKMTFQKILLTSPVKSQMVTFQYLMKIENRLEMKQKLFDDGETVFSSLILVNFHKVHFYLILCREQ